MSATLKTQPLNSCCQWSGRPGLLVDGTAWTALAGPALALTYKVWPGESLLWVEALGASSTCRSPEPPADCCDPGGRSSVNYRSWGRASSLLSHGLGLYKPTFSESEMLLQAQFWGSYSLPQSSILLQTRAQTDSSYAWNGHWAAKLPRLRAGGLGRAV